MRKYNHIGIPTLEPREGEIYLEQFGLHVAGFDTSRYGVEWMRFEPHCELPELVRSMPHVAFEVDDLDAELEGQEVLIAPNSPSPGLRVAFIVENGAPIELMEFAHEDDTRRGTHRALD